MIGQQKRLLEHTASSKPVKYQKHSDDKLCDAHTRVVSLTDENKLEFEQHFSGVSQKNAFSVSPGTSSDSMKVFERVLASEIKYMPQKDKDTPEPETGVCCGSHDNTLSDEHEFVRIADGPFSQSAKECTVEGREEDVGHSSDEVKETQDGGTSGTRQLITSAGFSPPRGSAVSTSEEVGRNNWSILESPARDLHVQLFGDEEEIGLIEDGPALSLPRTAYDLIDGDAFHATAQGTVCSPSTHYSQSLPVLLNDKVIDLYAMDEKVESYGGYEGVTSQGLWGSISEALGLGSHCGPGVKLIYFKHLKRLERGRGLPFERRQNNEMADDLNIRRPALSTLNGLLDEKGENYSLTDSEQFAESEPFLGRSGEQPVNGRSSTVRRDNPLDVDHSDDEPKIGSFKRDRDSAKLYSPYRTGGYPVMGNCSFSQECRDFPQTFLKDRRSLKAYVVDHHGDGPSKQTRELGTNVEEQVVHDVATIERCQKSLADTLTWIKRIAVEPGNPRIGQGPEGTGQDEKWASDCASQAQKVRTVLWRQKDDVRQGDGQSHQVKQHIPPPSQYYEDSARQEHQGPDRPRPTRERAAHYGSTSTQKPFNESVNYQNNSSPSFNQQPQWVGQTSQRLSRQNHHYSEDRYLEELLDIPKNRKRVPIGEDFQADIPPFRPVDRHPSSVGASGIAGPPGDQTQSSDGNDEEDHRRWQGKQVWPPPGGKRYAYNDHYLGRRRPSFCSCVNPESITCVRVHVEEERHRLKEELGQAFYIWKFDQMGEDVAAEWTKDEQHTYQTLVQLNPPSRGKNFWDQLSEAFPGKSTKEFVSFYFNVFVLRRRAIQNRLEAQHGDSDDDETKYPEYDSGEDSEDDYESGDEGDEEDDSDESEDDDETDKEEDGPYGSDSSAKLLEDTGFCDHDGYSSKVGVTGPLDEAHGAPMTVRTARLMNLEDVEQGYHDSHQEERDVSLGSAHMTAKWSQDEHDREKHLQDDHISVVGEEELQEVKTWEASHWDEAYQDDLGHDLVAEGISSKDDQTSPLYKKAVEGTNQHTCLMGSCEGDVWGPTLDVPSINKREKLLSTNGMIQEFFGNGNESSGLNASS